MKKLGWTVQFFLGGGGSGPPDPPVVAPFDQSLLNPPLRPPEFQPAVYAYDLLTAYSRFRSIHYLLVDEISST